MAEKSAGKGAKARTANSSKNTASSSKSTARSSSKSTASPAKSTPTSIESIDTRIIAEPTTPPKRSGNESGIIAYVHQLSPVQRNKKNTVDYCTLLLQTKDNPSQGALLYSKRMQKRPLLVDSEKCRTPVKIQRFTHTSDGEKVIINDMTQISVPSQTEYCFQFKESISRTQHVSIGDILSRCNEWENVTLKGKVVRVGDTKIVGAKELKLAEVTFADSTGSIAVDVWEQHIPMIENGKVYRVTPVQVRSWGGKKKLSTTVHSVITAITDETLSKVFVSEEHLLTDQCNEIAVKVPNIHSVKSVEKFIHCLNKYCSRRLIQTSSANIVHCDRCGYTMRSANCTEQLCAKVVIEVDGQEIHLTAFQNVLNSIFEGQGNCTLSLTEVSEKLLLLEEINIKYNSETQIITELQL